MANPYRDFQGDRHQGLCRRRVRRPHAGRHGADRHRDHAVANAWRILPSGAVAATFALTNALLSPQLMRYIDRFGQTRVAVPTTTLSVLAFALLIVATNRHWPTWTLRSSGFRRGPYAEHPGDGACTLDRDLSCDRPSSARPSPSSSAGDELVYILGASISVGLSVALFPEAGVLASTLFLAPAPRPSSASVRPSRQCNPPRDGRPAPPYGCDLVQIITFALIAVGATFATTEVTVVALTKAVRQPGAATYVIGVYALGSPGRRPDCRSTQSEAFLRWCRQLLVAVGVIAATALLPALTAVGADLAGGGAARSGVSIALIFISAFTGRAWRVPAAMLTEGVTWAATAIGIGMAAGSAIAGWVTTTAPTTASGYRW